LKLRIKIILVAILLSNSIFTQNWAPVASFNGNTKIAYHDELNNELYFCGYFKVVNGEPMYQVTKWDGNTFSEIGCGIVQDCMNLPVANLFVDVNDVIVYHDTIYATGGFTTINGQISNSIVRFNGSNWEPVGEGLIDNDGYRGVGHRLKIINDELYVCGQFSFCNGVAANSIAKYNGYTWSSVFDVPQIYSGARPIKDIEYYKGSWFVGGHFYEYDNFGGPKWNILQYNGSEWDAVGEGIPGSLARVEGFEIYEGKLMVYGAMSKSWGSPGNGIAAWNGEQWDDVGGGLENFVDNHILDAQVINGKLYATGSIKFAGGVFAPNIAVWDGENWCSLGTELNTFQGDIYSIVEFNNEIIVSGGFNLNETDTTIKNIVKWTGGDFVSACGNATSIEDKQDLDSFEIYPNPISNQLNIRNSSLKGTFQVSILDATGRLIQNEQFSSIGTHTLNLCGLAKGIYYCRIMQGNEVVVVEKVTKF
jgi:trimeric autotransporter adhesin